MLILEEYFRRHLDAFASELFIYIYIYILGVARYTDVTVRYDFGTTGKKKIY